MSKKDIEEVLIGSRMQSSLFFGNAGTSSNSRFSFFGYHGGLLREDDGPRTWIGSFGVDGVGFLISWWVMNEGK